MATPQPAPGSIPLAYRLFFLYIEPVSALAGAYFAYFRQADYLALTHAPTATTLLSLSPLTPSSPSTTSPSTTTSSPLPTGISIILSQLANLYLLFALNEALVLRAARRDRRVWNAVLFGLLVADLGHLASVAALGSRVYWDVVAWNAIDWGNVPFVYFGAAMRVAFLAGVGLGREGKGKGRGKVA